VTANTASGSGSGVAGIFNGSGSTANIKNSIVAQNTSALMLHDLNGTFNSQGYNLIGKSAGTDGFTNGVNGDQVGTYGSPLDPKLGVLTDNAGPTKTHALLAGSPAIDAGNSALTTDQRGQPRPVDDQTVANAAGGNASDIGAYEAHNLEVNSTADTDDGLCRTLGTGNGCTLREAINAANLELGAEQINFAPALTSGGPATITLLTALADLSSDLSINGPGAALLTVRRSSVGGTPNFRIFTLVPATTVNISSLTISNGLLTGSGSGGGILVDGATLNLLTSVITGNHATNGAGIYGNVGTLNIASSTISGNGASNGAGGGITNNSGVLNLTNSTVSSNTCDAQGGGLVNANFNGSSSTANISNSTFNGNSSSGLLGASIGGIANLPGNNTLKLTNCTITDNIANGSSGLAGGIVNNFGNTATLRNTIVAKNSGGFGDLSGSFVSRGHNLIGGSNGTNGFTNGTNGDQVGALLSLIDPMLGPLGNNGGPTQTRALLPGSVAIDTGDNCVVNNSCSPTLGFALAFDQRGAGFNRAVDANNDGAVTVDVGAFEVQSMLVTNTADSGLGSFRQAIIDANASPDSNAINFQPGLTGTITLATALPDLSTTITINGPGADQLTIQRSAAGGTPNFRIFTIPSGATVSISGLTIANGLMTGINVRGGGLINNGTLAMTNCNVYGNSAADIGGGGGGIFSDGPLLTLKDCNIGGTGPGQSNNGGGIFHSGGANEGLPNRGILLVTGGTISGNSGGGLFAVAAATLNGVVISDNSAGNGLRVGGNFPTNVFNCLIANNMNFDSGGFGGGGIYNFGSVNVVNTTVSGNSTRGSGGGIVSFNATLTALTNVTVTNNRSDSDNSGGEPAGGMVSSGSVVLKNTIVAGNFRGPLPSTIPDDTQFLINSSSSFNLIGTCNDCGLTDGVNNNRVGVTNPLLGALADNGGLTRTHALLPGSPALDSGNNSFITSPPFSGPPFTDQRTAGFARIVDGPDADTTDTVDIGAYEAQVSVADISDQAINEDGSLSLPFNVGGAITSVTASSSNTTLVPNNPANISISGSGSSRSLLINPVANAFGTATITVTVNGNNSQTMTDTFLLTVNSVNDPPSFSKGADQTVNENDGAQTVNSWATNISAGPANESGQTLTFLVTNNSNPALFAVAPAISSTGTLTYTPATGVSGTAAITIAVMDNGGTANGGGDTSATQSFNINVREGGTLAFSIASYSAGENSGSASITITRSGGTAGTATVNFATSDGTATAADYTAVSQSITFNDGEGSKTVNVPIIDDLFNETDETVNLALSNAGGSGQLGLQTSAVLTIVDNDPVGGYLHFSSHIHNTTENSGETPIVVERLGTNTQAVTVDYATSDDNSTLPCSTVNGIASSRCDFTPAMGTLHFAAGETYKTIMVLISQDSFVEGPETLTLTLSNVMGGAELGTPSTAPLNIADDATEPATNPIDSADAFVRQHYHDFLNREPDPDGLAFWTNQITECEQPGATCNAEVRRINVSAAFFLSIEFQETGYLVERLYKVGYGSANGTSTFGGTHGISVPFVRFKDFLTDTQSISQGVVVGQTGWEQVLENNKVAFIQRFVQRGQFLTSMSPQAFVDLLFENAGVTPTASERDAAIGEFGSAINVIDVAARARAVRRVAENPTLAHQESNSAFVLMQYMGYLRRNPNDAPDIDYTGYDFWLTKLNQFNGNFVTAEMVKAFIVSDEYRHRFGP